MDTKKVVAELLKNGAKKFENIKVKNVNVKAFDNYCRLSLTCDKSIPFLRTKDDGTQETIESNVIITTTYAIGALLRNDEDASAVLSDLMEVKVTTVNDVEVAKSKLSVILSGATIDIVQEDVATGTEYHNPFSSDTESKSDALDHDIKVNHIINLELSERNKRRVAAMADKILGLI